MTSALRKAGLAPEEITDAILVPCSGLLDGVLGQVLMIDRGIAFSHT
jgi:hypothetical protein